MFSPLQANYPEYLGHMFIINAPLVFSAMWRLIKPWLEERTHKKIQVRREAGQRFHCTAVCIRLVRG